MQSRTNSTELLIAGHPFFKGLEPALLRTLMGISTFATYDTKQPIISEGGSADHLFLIHKGTVSLDAHLPGRGPVTLQILGAGESLGCSWLFPPFRWRYTGHPLELTEVTMLDARSLRERAKQNHEFGYELAMRINQVLLQRLQATRALLVDYHGVTE